MGRNTVQSEDARTCRSAPSTSTLRKWIVRPAACSRRTDSRRRWGTAISSTRSIASGMFSCADRSTVEVPRKGYVRKNGTDSSCSPITTRQVHIARAGLLQRLEARARLDVDPRPPVLVEETCHGVDVRVGRADVHVEAVLDRPEHAPKPDVFRVLAVRDDRLARERGRPSRSASHSQPTLLALEGALRANTGAFGRVRAAGP